VADALKRAVNTSLIPSSLAAESFNNGLRTIDKLIAGSKEKAMKEAIKWPLFVILLVIPGGWLVLLGIAFVWAVRTGDDLAAYSRQSYAEFCEQEEEKKEKKQ
jgi:hypothetical protein